MEGVHWRVDRVMWGEGQMRWCDDAWLHAHVLGHGVGYWMAGRMGWGCTRDGAWCDWMEWEHGWTWCDGVSAGGMGVDSRGMLWVQG